MNFNLPCEFSVSMNRHHHDFRDGKPFSDIRPMCQYPFRCHYTAPLHVTANNRRHDFWRHIGMKSELIDAPWPTVDEAALIAKVMVLPVQVNGKLRGQIEIDANANQEEITDLALAHSGVQRHVEGKEVKKVIFVPDKMVSIVV